MVLCIYFVDIPDMPLFWLRWEFPAAGGRMTDSFQFAHFIMLKYFFFFIEIQSFVTLKKIWCNIILSNSSFCTLIDRLDFIIYFFNNEHLNNLVSNHFFIVLYFYVHLPQYKNLFKLTYMYIRKVKYYFFSYLFSCITLETLDMFFLKKCTWANYQLL